MGLEEEANRLHIGMNRIYNLSDNPKEWKDLGSTRSDHRSWNSDEAVDH